LRENSNLPPIDFQIRSTDQSETLGIDGVPRGIPLARSLVPKTHSIKRNRKSTIQNTSNPRAPKTPKSSPLTHRFGRGIKGKRTTKGSHEFPPSEFTKSKAPKTHQEQQNKALRNHAESSIHTMEVHTKFSLPPDHPTLSHDLTMKL
jgi:hypothetical protein